MKNWLQDIETKGLIDGKSFILPQDISEFLHADIKDISFFRKHGISIQTNLDSIDIIKNYGQYETKWASEEEPRKPTEFPKFEKTTVPTFAVYAKPIISQRLLEDFFSDIEETIRQQVTESITMAEIEAFLYGDGKNKPKGILTSEKIQRLTIKENNILAAIMESFSKLENIYRKDAIWVINRSIADAIYNIKIQNLLFMAPNINGKMEMNLLGLPIYISDQMKENDLMLLINIKKSYCIVDRKDISLLKDPYSNKPMVELYFQKRVGGEILDTKACILINIKKI